LGRVVAATQNALEIARLGGLDTGEGTAPHTIVDVHAGFRLRHYFPANGEGSAVLLVPPLMLDAEVYDVTRTCGVSAVRDACSRSFR
jgi:putative long chain acyl-CoA synthase